MTPTCLAVRVQRRLERFYALEPLADVRAFIQPSTHGGRERLLVRLAADGAVEMRLELPATACDLDGACQVIEGVSHFVYVARSASHGNTVTALELEIQAEVDKYVVLSGDLASLDVPRSVELRARLYERFTYVHADRELDERYRVANQTASRFVYKLERAHVARGRLDDLRRELRRFFRSDQETKLRRAA